ncbi:MAG: hypothetical protein IT205_06685 [Fimbriimonadaceae bacterium]|nr:hypothetical protein [Fimbriimonadaceae bacterium]
MLRPQKNMWVFLALHNDWTLASDAIIRLVAAQGIDLLKLVTEAVRRPGTRMRQIPIPDYWEIAGRFRLDKSASRKSVSR